MLSNIPFLKSKQFTSLFFFFQKKRVVKVSDYKNAYKKADKNFKTNILYFQKHVELREAAKKSSFSNGRAIKAV